MGVVVVCFLVLEGVDVSYINYCGWSLLDLVVEGCVFKVF